MADLRIGAYLIWLAHFKLFIKICGVLVQPLFRLLNILSLRVAVEEVLVLMITVAVVEQVALEPQRD